MGVRRSESVASALGRYLRPLFFFPVRIFEFIEEAQRLKLASSLVSNIVNVYQ